MNGAARCRRRRCQLWPGRGARGGARRDRPPAFPVSHSGTWAGARGREAPTGGISPRTAPALPPPRWAAARGARTGCGGRRARRRLWLSLPSSPFLPAVGARGAGRGDRFGRRAREEKRSGRCCKIAVTTLPGVWVGSGRNGPRKMGGDIGASSAAAASSPRGPSPRGLRGPRPPEARFSPREMSCVPSAASEKSPP